MKHFLMPVFIVLCCDTHAQNVGVGTSTPLTPLDVNSTNTNHVFRIDGKTGTYMSINENGVYRGYLGSFGGNDEDVDFGTGSNNTTGKLHLSINANPKFTVRENGNVGINTTNPLWLLDVNGNLNVVGTLNIGGSSGEAGQLLVSNGLAAPSWQTASSAFQNNVRFEATFNSESSLSSAFYTSVINTNTSAVTIASSGITINRTGLYHIEGYYQSFTRFTTEPAYFGHSFSLAFGSRSYVQRIGVPFAKSTSETTTALYNSLENFVQEVYIFAPTTISLLRADSRPFGVTPTSTSHSGRISGYLISE